MPIPSVPFKVLAQGYRIDGERGGPPVATVLYLVAWADAFTFYSDCLGYPKATTFGIVTYTPPYQFPPYPVMYATQASIEPCGCNGEPLATNKGLSPGEFFTHAKVTVTFGVTPWNSGGGGDDPGNLNQLDPANPITYCEQSMKSGGKMTNVKGSGYAFDSGATVEGDFAKVDPEARLVLSFPRVPYLPWQVVSQFVGTVNDRVVLQCARGTLLFEGADSKFTATSQGTQGQMVQLEFAYQPIGSWNELPNPKTGKLELVQKKTIVTVAKEPQRIYAYKNFANLFNFTSDDTYTMT